MTPIDIYIDAETTRKQMQTKQGDKMRQVIIDGVEYIPKKQIKSLLADAKVGDLCKTDLDEWIQIDDAPEPPSPILYHFDRPLKGNIIHTEPLAPEGSAEWAWQMLKLGKPVTNKWVFTAGGYIKDTDSDKYRFVQMWDFFSDWQLYEPEPDYVICRRCGGSQSVPNPAVSNTAYTTCPKCGGTGYEIREQKPDDLYLNITPSNLADWCFDKKNFLVLVDDNFKRIVGENVTREQVGEIAKLLTEPAKEPEIVAHKQHANCLVCGKVIEGLLDGHATVSIKRYSISSLYESTYSHYCGKCFLELGFDKTERELRNRQRPIAEPEPEPKFAVGDWVEFNPGNNPKQVEIVEIDGDKLYYNTRYAGKTIKTHIYASAITRKLDPSEVIVRIGCLSGTVAPGCSDATIMIVPIGYNRFGDVAIVPVAMLDAPTRELVKALLKAQEEK